MDTVTVFGLVCVLSLELCCIFGNVIIHVYCYSFFFFTGLSSLCNKVSGIVCASEEFVYTT